MSWDSLNAMQDLFLKILLIYLFPVLFCSTQCRFSLLYDLIFHFIYYILCLWGCLLIWFYIYGFSSESLYFFFCIKGHYLLLKLFVFYFDLWSYNTIQNRLSFLFHEWMYLLIEFYQYKMIWELLKLFNLYELRLTFLNYAINLVINQITKLWYNLNFLLDCELMCL